MSFELTADGLSTMTQAEIVAELAARLRARFGVNFRADDTKSQVGQLVHILSEIRALDQQTALAVYASFDPNGALGRALDARVGLTGTTRKGATSSSVTGILTFTAIATATAGMFIRNETDDSIWQLTNGPYTSAGAETWPAIFEAVDTGPKLAMSNTTWAAVTIIAGITGFTNPTDDATLGRLRETDGELRKRRLVELYAQGAGPLAAIAGRVSRVEGVLSARVYHNPATPGVDADGIPFKAFNVLVETSPSVPGAALQQLILDAIWSGMAAGGQAYGTSYSGTVTDSEGQPQPIAFDVVAQVDLIAEIDLVTSTSEDPITPNMAATVKARILEVFAAEYALAGRDVRSLDFSGIVGAMLTAGTITGVDAVVVRIALTPDPAIVQAKVAIGIRQKPDLDSANLTVALV